MKTPLQMISLSSQQQTTVMVFSSRARAMEVQQPVIRRPPVRARPLSTASRPSTEEAPERQKAKSGTLTEFHLDDE
jgi:hypothetical protein